MYRIRYACYCCFLLPLIVSCLSGTAQRTSSLPTEKGQIASVQLQAEAPAETADIEGKQEAETYKKERLFPDLIQAVAEYDIHKALALFGAISDAVADSEDDAILAAAREKIRPLLEAISVEAVSAPDSVSTGSSFPQPFAARVVVTAPEKQFPLDNYPMKVSYPAGGKEESDELKTEIIKTDSEGFLYFVPPTPQKASDGVLYFYLSLTGRDAAPTDIPENLCARFPYKVATVEKRTPTIITILDYDENNKPVFSNNVTATRLLTGLMKRGFSRIGLDEYRELIGSDETQVIRAAQAKIGTAVDRFIFGKTYISIETTENDTFICTIRAELSVWNFKQAKKTNRFTFEYTTEAKTKNQVIYLARTDLGESIIANALNYNL